MDLSRQVINDLRLRVRAEIWPNGWELASFNADLLPMHIQMVFSRWAEPVQGVRHRINLDVQVPLDASPETALAQIRSALSA